MDENREYFLQVLRYYMTEIMDAYKEAYPDADYLEMSFDISAGTMKVNNSYFGADPYFPISEIFDGIEWYDYRKGKNK